MTGHKRAVPAKPTAATKGIDIREMLKQAKFFLYLNLIFGGQFFVKLKDRLQPFNVRH